MTNRIWQAEEEKWEKRRQRAEKVLDHIRELRRLEAEEEEEEPRPKEEPSLAGQADALAGQGLELAGQAPTEVRPITAPLTPPSKDDRVLSASKKERAKDLIPGLLVHKGAMTVKAMAEALDRSQQAIANALAELKGDKMVKEEPSTVPGFKYQYRLTTEEERQAVAAGQEERF